MVVWQHGVGSVQTEALRGGGGLHSFGNASALSIDLRFDLKRSEIDSSSIFYKSDKKRFHCLYLAAEEESRSRSSLFLRLPEASDPF